MLKSNNVVKSSKYLSNLTGAAKQTAKGGLDDAVNTLNKAKSKNPSLHAVSEEIGNIGKKIQNIDKNLPGDITNNLKNAQKQLEYTGIKNKSLMERRQQQNAIQNFFDTQSKSAQKEMNKAQKNLINAQKQQQKAKQVTLNNLNVDLDANNAFKKQLEDASGITDMNQKVSDMQKAYDKATRATTRTRMATIGGAGAIAYGANKANQAKNKEQPQYNYYGAGLNNSF